MLGTGRNNGADGKRGGEGPALPSPHHGQPRRLESHRAGQCGQPVPSPQHLWQCYLPQSW